METQNIASPRIEMVKADPNLWMVVNGSLPKNVIERIIWDKVVGLLPNR